MSRGHLNRLQLLGEQFNARNQRTVLEPMLRSSVLFPGKVFKVFRVFASGDTVALLMIALLR